MLAIFKREFKSLFWNITGWLFIGITLALFGLYFFVYNLSYGYPYDCEGQVTAAIQYVTSESTTNVYELTGHDESTLSGDFSEVFQKRFMNVGSLSLLTVDAIPEDCQAIFITAP